MARHKEFDTNVALDRAMETFWTRGYAGTSIQDLVEAIEQKNEALVVTT